MTASSLFGALIFGSIGFAVLIYGKKQASFKKVAIGIALMAYSYFVPNAIIMYGIGIALIAALLLFPD